MRILASTLVMLSLAGCGGTNGPDPYSSFRLGQSEDAVVAKAKHAYGEVTDTSGDPGGEFCYVWASPYTKLCFLNGSLFDKSR